jgi:hypothetical protein
MVTTNIQSFSGNVEVAGTLSVTGNLISTTGVDKVDLSTDTTNALRPVIFSTGTTGSQSLKTDPGITYNPSTKTFTLTDNITASNATVSDYLIHKDNTNTYLGFPADDTIAFTTGGGEKMRITSTGNLGVGSAAPAYKLHVVGNTYVTSNLTVGTANLHVDTLTGNVGIGTNSPAYKLDVRGTASHAGSELMARWNSQNETVFPQDITAQYHKIATLGTTGDGSNGGKLRISGTIGGFGESSTTLIDAFVSTRGGPSYGGTLHGYGGGDDPIDKVDILVYKEADDTFAVWIKLVRFFTFDFTVTGGTITGASRTLVLLPCPVTDTSVATPTGTLEGSVVSACSIVFTAGGNLGIGTTNPTSNLHVVGDAYVNSNLTVGTANLHVDTTTGFVGVGTNNPVGVNGGNRLEGSSATGFEFISSRADNTTEIDDFIGAYLFKNTDTDGNAPHYCGMSAKGATTNGAMSLYFHSQRDKYELGNTPDLFIDTNGRVGVGTDDPDYTLDVVGTGGFSSNLTVGTANLHVDTLTGNVGIGTTTPIFTLDVHGTSNVGALTATTVNATTFTGSMSQSLSNGSYLTGDAYDGSVARTFAVDATTDSTANKIVARDASGNVYADRLFTADYLVHEGDINTYFGFPSNDTITFTTTGDERMRVDQYGNVAIGTTSAPYKLNVAGTANVGALSATTVTFSDDLAVGTNKFFVDVSSSNVGIGTANPGYKLDVVGETRATSFILNRTTITDAYIDANPYTYFTNSNDNDSSYMQFLHNYTDVVQAGSGPNSEIMSLQVKGKSDGTTDADTEVYIPGSLGVGTASPGYTLDVHGTSNVGALTATSVSGDGSGLTSLNAGNISSGKIDNTRLNEASTTGAGIVQLSDSTNGTSTTTAATESAVKAAYDRNSWGSGTFSDVLKLGGGTSTGDANVEDANKTNTYIRFDEAGTGTDWAYLRQIGGNNAIKLALDFHDDNEARFEIRKVNSSSGTGAGEVATTVFSVDDGALTATTGTFSDALTATTGTFSDALTATSAAISGDIAFQNSGKSMYTFNMLGMENTTSQTTKMTFTEQYLSFKCMITDYRSSVPQQSVTREEFHVTYYNTTSAPVISNKSYTTQGDSIAPLPARFYFDSTTKTFTIELVRKSGTIGSVTPRVTLMGLVSMPTLTSDTSTPPGVQILTSEGVNVSDGGNVGIGTTSPGYTLDVHGTSNVGALTATSATVPNDGDFVMGGKPLKPAGGLHWDRVNSRLGVGTVSPNLELHVHDANNSTSGIILSSTTGYHRLYEASGQLYFQSGTTASADSRADINFTSMYASTTYMKILGSNGNVGIGTTSPVTPLHIKQSGRDGATTVDLDTLSNAGITVERSDTANRWIQGLNALNNYYFWYSADGSAPATSKAFFDENGSNNVDQNFTGQHRTFIKDVPFTEAGDLEGLIVSADQNKYIKMTGGIEAGSNAITTNESLPVVSLSTKVNDKKCFGVVSTSEDPETRANRFGNIVSVSQKELGDTRVYINSVGEGAMWVVNTMGSLESGDYITTSNVAGYGQRQDDDILHNYTVAKITMDCDFDPVTQPIQIIKKELTNVNYWVKTTVSNVTLEEYSNLAEENRTTELETYYTKDIEQTYTYKPIVEVTAEDSWDDVSMWPSDVTYAEWSNLEANVQNTYTLTYTQNDFETVRYEKTTVSNVSSEGGWDAVHIEPSTVTYAEWSNLEANVQNTFTLTYTTTATVVATEEEYTHLVEEEQVLYEPVYTKTTTEEVGVDTEGADVHTRPIYKKIEREESKTETEGYDLEVREELVNALDEHGQLQWEDDPSGATEKAYKIRYLDASGTQTDEANAVHIAAFVGVTYHCG